MTDLPTLDRLHAEATPGEWRAGSVETDAVFVPCSDCMGPERVILRMNKSFPHEADAAWIATIHNTWPQISARVKELEADLSRVLKDGFAQTDRDESRIRLLEETLRGILQEKQTARDMNERPTTEQIDQQIAWLESVLGDG